MKQTSKSIYIIMLAVILAASSAGVAADEYFPSFADEHTVGLWLFDETDYPYTNITDAGKYEYDLRLLKGGSLVPGKFGRCLKCTPGLDYNVNYSSWKGHIAFKHMREVSGRPGSGLWGPAVAPEKLLNALSKTNFTCEFWILLMSNPIQDVVIIDLGDKYEPGFTVTLKKKAQGFVVENTYAGFKAVCPTNLNQLWGRAWHHIALSYSAGSNNFMYFIDGRAQPPVPIVPVAKSKIPPGKWPESLNNTTYGIFEKKERTDAPDFEKRRSNRFNMALGQDRHGEKDLNGNIDELRFSDVVRYRSDFSLPDSLSRNYRKDAPKPAVANGPPLSFGHGKKYLPGEAVMLGSRKHVFIDEVMIDRKHNVRLTVNPPTDPVETNVTTRGDTPVFDHDNKVWMVQTPGYGSDVGRIRLMIAKDGINFTQPDLNLIEDEDTKPNNIILTHLPCWGRFFKDTNPNAGPEEKFKFTAWSAQRGIYLYLSPDGIHWRRNETCMMPLVSGGGCETFWDDQRGVYFNLLKRDGSYNTGDYPAYGRGATVFETREITKAWPIKKIPNPYFEGWAFPAVTGEGITVMGPDLFDPDFGQVFRTRARKYQWAPDTYVAFLNRNARTELAVSRDCINWRIYDTNDTVPYLPKNFVFNGVSKPLKWIQDGLIRRGDKIWQYINHSTNNLRFSQRLDGFTSLDAGDSKAIIITKPLIFEGNKLIINANVTGSMKIGLLNLPGMEISGYNIGLTDKPKKPIPGFNVANCKTITGDSVRHQVKWNGDPMLENLTGRVVRLRIEMQNAKLYAFKFE